MNADTVTAPALPAGSTNDATSHLLVGEPVSLAGLNAEQVLARLRELRGQTGGPVAIEAPLPAGRSALAEATDFAEVDGHVYAGWAQDGAWFFQPTSLAMACLHAGWLVAGSLSDGMPERPVDPNEPAIAWSEENADAYRRAWQAYRESPEYRAFHDGPWAAYWSAFLRFINNPWGDSLHWVLAPNEAAA